MRFTKPRYNTPRRYGDSFDPIEILVITPTAKTMNATIFSQWEIWQQLVSLVPIIDSTTPLSTK